jgi:hypothetical protein
MKELENYLPLLSQLMEEEGKNYFLWVQKMKEELESLRKISPEWLRKKERERKRERKEL